MFVFLYDGGSSPSPSSAAFAATLAGVSLAASATHTGPASSSGSLSAALAGVGLATTATHTGPASSSSTLAATLAGVSLASTATHVGPASSAGSFAATLGGVALAASGLASAAGSAASTFAATLAGVGLSAAATHAGPGGSTASFNAALSGMTLSASASYAGPSSTAAAFTATLSGIRLASSVLYVAPGGSTPIRDYHLLADAVARLEATGLFDGVYLASPGEYAGQATFTQLAFVYQTGFAWDDQGTTGDEADVYRNVEYRVAIIARDPDPTRRYARLDQAGAAASNALSGVRLADASMPATTRLRMGRYVAFPPPLGGLELRGEAQRIVAGYQANDERDDIDDLDP